VIKPAPLVIAPPCPRADPAEATAGRPWLALAALAGLWFLLVNQLRVDWEINPQYSYGWLVPFLALYLFWQRWASRPSPRPWRWTGLLVAAGGLLAFLLFPTRLVQEATPDWSVVSWLLALEVIGLTLAGFAFVGGWPWLRHFAWPICFILVAVAWPVRFETALTQSLMRHLAALTAELVTWAGVYAAPQGNLIRLQAGVLGVDEACSGVRSLQSMLMASLFQGELKRLTWRGRIGLVFVGLALAVCCNILRALGLITVVIQQGLSALDRWHDPAGFSILAISFVGLCLAVRFFRKTPVDQLRESQPGLPRRVPALFAIGLLGWYRAHETPRDQVPRWSIRWPAERPEFRELPVAPNVRKILAYNEGRQAAWKELDGSRWLMFACEWYPARTSTQSARAHRPEVCMPATGQVLIKEREPLPLQVGAATLQFRSYLFDDRGRPLHVYFCLWEAANRDRAAAELLQDWSGTSRLQRVLTGQRNLGQQSVEVIVSGPASPEEADRLFRLQMASLLSADR
jgi:exosortase